MHSIENWLFIKMASFSLTAKDIKDGMCLHQKIKHTTILRYCSPRIETKTVSLQFKNRVDFFWIYKLTMYFTLTIKQP